jgi:hypothetical protein
MMSVIMLGLSFIVVLNVIMLCVIIPNVVMMSVVALFALYFIPEELI